MNNSTTLEKKDLGLLPAFLSGDGTSLQVGPQKSKGTKIVAATLVAGVVGVAGWAFIKFALPAIMAILSPVIAAVISFFLVMFAVAMIKPVWKWFTAIADKVYKKAIRYNPEVAIENKIRKFDDMIVLYRNALAKVRKTSSDFKQLAGESEKEAEEITERLKEAREKAKVLRIQLQEKELEVKKLKAEVDSGKRKTQKDREPYYKALNEFTNLQKQYDNLLSKSSSDQQLLKVDVAMTERYAAKANIFERWIRFLDLGSNQIDNKKRELTDWWAAVKKEMNAANAGRDATDALQFILRDANGGTFEFNYATEVIIDKINEDYSITAQNMQDLKRSVDGFDFNSEDAFNKLEKMLDDMESGKIEIPSAIEISNIQHDLTASEKQAAGPLGNIF